VDDRECQFNQNSNINRAIGGEFWEGSTQTTAYGRLASASADSRS